MIHRPRGKIPLSRCSLLKCTGDLTQIPGKAKYFCDSGRLRWRPTKSVYTGPQTDQGNKIILQGQPVWLPWPGVSQMWAAFVPGSRINIEASVRYGTISPDRKLYIKDVGISSQSLGRTGKNELPEHDLTTVKL